MAPSTSLVAKVILLLLAISILGFAAIRTRRTGRTILEVIAIVVVSVGLILLLAYQFNLLGDLSERALSISGVMILGGVAFDLIARMYKKLTGDPDKSSI